MLHADNAQNPSNDAYSQIGAFPTSEQQKFLLAKDFLLYTRHETKVIYLGMHLWLPIDLGINIIPHLT